MALICGGIGLLVPIALAGVSMCCVDQGRPTLWVQVYNKAFNGLWPTSGFMTPYLQGGPIDRDAIRRNISISVAANGLVYALAGLVIGFLKERLRTAEARPYRPPNG